MEALTIVGRMAGLEDHHALLRLDETVPAEIFEGQQGRRSLGTNVEAFELGSPRRRASDSPLINGDRLPAGSAQCSQDEEIADGLWYA